MTTSNPKKLGFTLIELIMVLVILGFLAVAALPQYVDLSTKATQANEDGVAGGVRAGIATQLASAFASGDNSPDFVTGLDAATSNSTCGTAQANACFSAVVPGGVSDGNWFKTSALVYSGPTSTVYTYNSATGAFT